jgi:hypothetical protein
MSLLYKAIKTKSGGILFSRKGYSFLKRENSKITSFVSQTGRTFATGGDRRFEKLSDRSSGAVRVFNFREMVTTT